MRILAVLLLACLSAAAQVSYFNQGFLRQPDAPTDRAYLGISNSTPFFTNLVGITSGTNILFTTNGGIVSINTSNGAFDLLPRNNTWTGTNVHSKDVRVQNIVTAGTTNDGSGGLAAAKFWTHQDVNRNISTYDPSPDTGIGLASYNDARATISGLKISGAPLIFDTGNAGAGAAHIDFRITTSEKGRMDNNGNFDVGAGSCTFVGPGALAITLNDPGNIFGTNRIVANNYFRGIYGMVITSNSWLHAGLNGFGASDTLWGGDNFYVSSNGVPAIIINRPPTAPGAPTSTNWIYAGDRGIAQLVNSTVTVNTSLASSTKVYSLAYISLNGTSYATVFVRNIVPGVSFDIKSSDATDNNQVAWTICGP